MKKSTRIPRNSGEAERFLWRAMDHIKESLGGSDFLTNVIDGNFLTYADAHAIFRWKIGELQADQFVEKVAE